MATEQAVAIRSSGAMAAWASRDEVRELDSRLAMMLPGADKLNTGQRLALAQASLAHGLDPFNGEIWMIPGRGMMIGVKGLRKKAREQVKGNFWTEFVELADPDARRRMRIPEGALAYECRLFDSENLRTYANTCEQLLKAGIPWDAVSKMVGSKPYTPGVGVLKAGESTKMEPAQCAMKRAEADALKRRFDVPFGLAVEADADPEEPIGGEWVEAPAAPAAERTPEQAEAQERGMGSLFGNEPPEPELAGFEAVREDVPVTAAATAAEPAPFKPATVKVQARQADWRKALQELVTAHPKYQTVVKGKPSGQPNMYHLLGAAAKCGFSVIDDGNFEVVIEAISKRASELEPA